MSLLKFKEQGFVHLENVMDPTILARTRYLAINLKKKYQPLEGQPRKNGSGMFWKGLEMASTLEKELYVYYTDPFMFELAKTYLEISEPFLFNDQVVVKLPNEDFKFTPHFDNQYGPSPENALDGIFKTVNFCQILTNMPPETGPISCLNKQTNMWEVIPAKAGDIIAIEGNTMHSSTTNISDKIRALYACVYSSHAIGKFQSGFYNEKFKIR